MAKPVAIDSPATARGLGIAYVPEDRGLQGLIKPQTIRENVSLAIIDRLAKLLLIDRVRKGTGTGGDRAFRDPCAGTGTGGAPAFRRQSAEGGAGKMGGDGTSRADHG